MSQSNVVWSTLEVVPDNGKQVAADTGLEIANVGSADKPRTLISKKKWLLFGGIVALLVILAAVLGGVLGSRKSSESAPPTSPSNSSSSPSPAAYPYQRNIAAVSFEPGTTGGTRVYYQDDSGELNEALTVDNKTWTNTKLGFFPQNGSVLAAAVSRPTFPMQISVVYTNLSGELHDIIYDGTAWSAGTLGNNGYKTINDSAISVLYFQCGSVACSNTTIVTFINSSGVQIANGTSTGWETTQLNLDAPSTTGLGLQFHQYNSDNTEIYQINLYYLDQSYELVFAAWHLGAENWQIAIAVGYTPSFATPIAVSSSYGFTALGSTDWIKVLTIATNGIVVESWNGTLNGWDQNGATPMVMSNTTGNVRTFGSPAVTSVGSAFAVISQEGDLDVIQAWQMSDDEISWTQIGNVSIGTAWES